MHSLNIALMQLLPTGTLEGNLQKGLGACRKAKEMGADIALFPEMWSCGYSIAPTEEEVKATAISPDSPFLQAFGTLAKELDMAIGITYLESYSPLPRNSLRLFDRHGKAVLDYSKVHTCDFGDECLLYPGEDFPVTSLDTALGPVQIGAMICYDREFPEPARILMLRGAEVILVPNACGMELNRLCQLRSRAYENMTAIITVNYPDYDGCNGHSTVFDGVAYGTDDHSRDMLLLETDEQEGIFLAPLPLEPLRRFRAKEVHGNAFRRPRLYADLVKPGKQEPFIRKAYRDL